jgi:hypothetical protein
MTTATGHPYVISDDSILWGAHCEGTRTGSRDCGIVEIRGDLKKS